jgi:hypothetical protein
MEIIKKIVRYLVLDHRDTHKRYRLSPSTLARSYQLQLPVPGRIRKTKKKIRISILKGHLTRW